MERPPYQAIFFDLDGTLLPMDVDDFLRTYFDRVGSFAAGNGLDGGLFSKALLAGVKSMADHEEGLLNSEVFWRTFHRTMGSSDKGVVEMVERFYEEDFGSIGETVDADPAAARAVETLAGKGYPLYLTTMPMFPRQAVEWRLRWAGVDPSFFSHMTTYDNSTAVKPDLAYYRANVAAAGCAASDILMVGNNTREDMAALDLGMDGYLVTDHLLDPIGFDIAAVKHGSLADFADFAATLPEAR